MLFDVSGSMFTVDDLPEVGQDPATLPSRQAKVLSLLTSNLSRAKQPQTPLMDRVLAKTPLTLYRFGGLLDESFVLNLKEPQTWKQDELYDWLRPDKTKIAGVADKPEAEQQKERARLEDLYDGLLSGTNIGGAAPADGQARKRRLPAGDRHRLGRPEQPGQ